MNNITKDKIKRRNLGLVNHTLKDGVNNTAIFFFNRDDLSRHSIRFNHGIANAKYFQS